MSGFGSKQWSNSGIRDRQKGPNPPRGKRTGRAPVMHYTDTRLFVNAGMTFPACFAGAPVLDTDKGYLPSSRNLALVTCKRCLATMQAAP